MSLSGLFYSDMAEGHYSLLYACWVILSYQVYKANMKQHSDIYNYFWFVGQNGELFIYDYFVYKLIQFKFGGNFIQLGPVDYNLLILLVNLGKVRLLLCCFSYLNVYLTVDFIINVILFTY